ncbi:MAG: hypothetical protein RR058_03045 [Oscillospiraceae bacterium]
MISVRRDKCGGIREVKVDGEECVIVRQSDMLALVYVRERTAKEHSSSKKTKRRGCG